MIRVFFLVMAFLLAASSTANFKQDITITWGGPRAQIQPDGQLLTLSLDKESGSGFVSKNQYLYGRFDMQLKLVPGDSAGIVTTFYLSSEGSAHDEIDFEFLGNSSGQPYTLHTNLYIQGVDNREQQFHLWFDPTAGFHSYTILWNSHRIIYMVDNIRIRVFNNYVAKGVPFPANQPMKMYGSLWNAEWATQGGRVKIDWTKAPFTATYRNYNVDGCVVSGSWNSCEGQNSRPWQNQGLNANGSEWIRWVQKNHMIYNYCNDIKRFPQGLPKECTLPGF